MRNNYQSFRHHYLLSFFQDLQATTTTTTTTTSTTTTTTSTTSTEETFLEDFIKNSEANTSKFLMKSSRNVYTVLHLAHTNVKDLL